MDTKPKIEPIAPVMDTGKWRAEVSRLLNTLVDEQTKTALQVKRVADAYDAEHKERETRWAAFRRGVMQIVKGLGWVE